MSAANQQPAPGVNRQILLAARPVGMPKESDFKLVDSTVPHPASGEALVRALYLSVDPYMRGRIGAHASYAKNIDPGEVMIGGVVGRVTESNDPRLSAGDVVEGMLGWQEYAVASAKSLRKIDPASVPISTALYVLGMPGLTAYFGLLDICKPQPGETVVVSAAAGGVGSLVGQIARIKRCRAVGVAGSNGKIRFITGELGYDGGFNYRDTPDYHAKLKELCPNGIDIYFDNVGGEITDAAIRLLNTRGRISVCGQVSEYNAEEPQMGPRWMGQLVVKQARAEGFLVHQFADRFEDGLKQLAAWLREKRIKYREDVVEGLENAPQAFIGMLRGENIGKRLVKVAE
ncbi:MAG: NADP-dependent oxidoreductase [Acidobacteriia bacterium]|nr:NADP-dependent oxidoreductase [Terriglobia bacterium]